MENNITKTLHELSLNDEEQARLTEILDSCYEDITLPSKDDIVLVDYISKIK